MLWVMKVNSFASRTIQVEAGQRLISRGPYRIVRHPMYLGSVVMWLATPLTLGSCFAWLAFALLVPFYVFRLPNEEKVLQRELPGYSEYCNATRFRRPLRLVRLRSPLLHDPKVSPVRTNYSNAPEKN